jgi:hypothetical protein
MFDELQRMHLSLSELAADGKKILASQYLLLISRAKYALKDAKSVQKRQLRRIISFWKIYNRAFNFEDKLVGAAEREVSFLREVVDQKKVKRALDGRYKI